MSSVSNAVIVPATEIPIENVPVVNGITSDTSNSTPTFIDLTTPAPTMSPTSDIVNITINVSVEDRQRGKQTGSRKPKGITKNGSPLQSRPPTKVPKHMQAKINLNPAKQARAEAKAAAKQRRARQAAGHQPPAPLHLVQLSAQGPPPASLWAGHSFFQGPPPPQIASSISHGYSSMQPMANMGLSHNIPYNANAQGFYHHQIQGPQHSGVYYGNSNSSNSQYANDFSGQLPVSFQLQVQQPYGHQNMMSPLDNHVFSNIQQGFQQSTDFPSLHQPLMGLQQPMSFDCTADLPYNQAPMDFQESNQQSNNFDSRTDSSDNQAPVDVQQQFVQLSQVELVPHRPYSSTPINVPEDLQQSSLAQDTTGILEDDSAMLFLEDLEPSNDLQPWERSVIEELQDWCCETFENN